MRTRLELHEDLCKLLGSRNVYYRPPESIKMRYPAIVYDYDSIETIHADNHPYQRFKRYSITIIDEDPDSTIPDQLAEWEMSSFSRRYVADGLNHDVYTIYY